MFEFLGRGKAKVDKSPEDHGASTQTQNARLSATQIEMVRMTLHGVLKLHGIPGTWIAGEVMPVRIPGQGEAVLLQLEVKHWHDALVLHAPAFQQAMLDGLKRFDAQADQTHYLFTWKFAPNCGCPHLQLPEPTFWTTSERVVLAPIAAATAQPVAAAAAAVAPTKVPFDLPDNDAFDDDQGFAPTQIRDPR